MINFISRQKSQSMALFLCGLKCLEFQLSSPFYGEDIRLDNVELSHGEVFACYILIDV